MTPLSRIYETATDAWVALLATTLYHGQLIAPRGQPTLEVLDSRVSFRLANPVVLSRARKLYYRFFHEALWILDGDDTVAGIAPYNKHIAAYSDDGVKFFGAYGPKVVAQLPYVVETLTRDRDSRQAVINIWRESPSPTKDVPCTLNFVFTIRDDKLNVHSRMRSNDLWLGAPYDMFNFALIGIRVTCLLNEFGRVVGKAPVGLGHLTHTAVSCHIYERDLAGVRAVLDETSQLPSQAGDSLADAVVFAARWDDIRAAVEAGRDANRPPVWPR